MLKSNLVIFEQLEEFLLAASRNPSPYVIFEGAFARATILSFKRVVLLITRLLKQSLALELTCFFTQIDAWEDLCSKSAFCQARQKLSSHFFVAWNTCLLNSFYEPENQRIKRWLGFRLCGVDGTQFHLPDYLALRQYFGQKKNQHGSTTMAKLVCCYDILNQLCLWSQLRPYLEDERNIAISQIGVLEPDMLMIYDRHYPSFESIYAHHLNGQSFLMRIKHGFTIVEDFLKTGLTSQQVNYTIRKDLVKTLSQLGYPVNKDTSIPVRLIRIELTSGETEVLVTSLIDPVKYPTECFGDLYFQRWQIETYFDRLKNKMALELFSGYAVNTIKQDVFAHIFMANIHSLIISESLPEVKKRSEKRYYPYQSNYNVTLGLLKVYLIQLFNPAKREKALIILHQCCLMNLEPIRENRSIPRCRKQLTHRKKHRTELNYKRNV